MMTNLQIKEDLFSFSKVLELVHHPLGLRAAKTQIFDMGLVILAKDSKYKAADVKPMLPEGSAYTFTLGNKNDYLLFAKAFFIANSEGRNLIVECLEDPSPAVISALKDLAERNVFTMPNFNNSELFSMPLNPKTRVIFCINEDFLNEKITHPYFINLFGPVLRIK